MQAGLLTTFHHSGRSRGAMGWVWMIIFFAVMCLFYFDFRLDLVGSVTESIGLDSPWTLYGILYTLAMIFGSFYFLRRHGNSRYHRVRTISLIFVQSVFAFSLPMVMEAFGSKGFIFSLFWPLKIEYFYPSAILEYPPLIILYVFFGFLIGVPLMTFFFGKRWYCSWVCGCGGLAETFGEPYRHLSDKGSKAWKFEQVSIYGVMFFAFATTAIVFANWGLHYTDAQGNWVTDHGTFDAIASKVQGTYQYIVVAMLSGVFGVGLYPIMGSRVWCRFFCPLAAVLGILQKLSRFRITVKDDMCISCGNCSTYCEMGIDVRAYAQNNQSFKRAACVGCGICAHVCPRGVLKLENKWDIRSGVDGARLNLWDM